MIYELPPSKKTHMQWVLWDFGVTLFLIKVISTNPFPCEGKISSCEKITALTASGYRMKFHKKGYFLFYFF